MALDFTDKHGRKHSKQYLEVTYACGHTGVQSYNPQTCTPAMLDEILAQHLTETCQYCKTASKLKGKKRAP